MLISVENDQMPFRLGIEEGMKSEWAPAALQAAAGGAAARRPGGSRCRVGDAGRGR